MKQKLSLSSKIVMLIFLCLIIPLAAAAQEEEEEEEQDLTIEELYLSQNVELQILRGQALSDDRDMKLLALQSIRSMIEEGGLSSENPGVLTVLEALANEGTRRQVRSGVAVTNNYPMVRKEAANLLGQIGGERSRTILLDIMANDPEPMVLSEAIYSLGAIEIDDDADVGQMMATISWALNNQTEKATPDNNFAYATLLAVEKISQKIGGIQDPEVINALLGVASGNYIRTVRLKAIDVIYEMRKGSGGK
ncbi:MAG: HEAT repeat domain-containing protein [Spirochaetia bacterium]